MRMLAYANRGNYTEVLSLQRLLMSKTSGAEWNGLPPVWPVFALCCSPVCVWCAPAAGPNLFATASRTWQPGTRAGSAHNPNADFLQHQQTALSHCSTGLRFSGPLLDTIWRRARAGRPAVVAKPRSTARSPGGRGG